MNNREVAAVVWLGIVLILGGTQPDIRRSFGSVVVTVVHPKLLIPLLAMSSYVACLIYAGRKAGIWNADLTGDTVAWAIGTGLVLYGKSVRVFTRVGSFRRLVLAAVGFTAV